MSLSKTTLLLTGTAILATTALVETGCTTVRATDPARTAREQLLLSTAADRALKAADLEIFKGRKVYLDETFFDSYDSKYAVGTIRDALSRAGALLVASADKSEIVVEARSGALSTDGSSSLFGIPSTGAPVPLTGTIQLPQIGFYTALRDHSIAKIALLAYTTQSREHVYSSGPLVGKSFDNAYDLLGFSWRRTDIPEKKDHKENADKYESWQPMYDPMALNSITNTPPPAATNAPAGTNSVPK